ncbi:MAG: phosphoribosyltransferase family protein [Romboutsia timonensis]|uniref:ComF family protein n=1 Tax=Romboutsia timonensis TaxID=1776391 RepID=UPI002A7666E0|nr:phosphoribosyltransferase family protein [Romboutsia timonensis]MDY2883455.1 phosphoribosyltransferase family protein [Romboutsia timonensis]
MKEDIIYYLHTYIPYRERKLNGEDDNSYKLIQFKYGNIFAIEEYRHKLINNKLIKNLLQQDNIAIACVPSHNPKNEESSIHTLADIICEELGFINASKCCNRVKLIDKLSTGGKRNKEIHLNSIKIINQQLIQNKTVLLIDDIATTGNSMNACQDLLKKNGAKYVYKLVLAHTPKYKE